MRIFFIICFIISQLSFSQNDIVYKKVASTTLEADSFYGVDDFLNLYFSKKNVLYKQTDKTTYQYNNPVLSNIASVDILNPLRITLFYKKLNTAEVLDNNLNSVLEINFSLLTNFKNIQFATTANSNNNWVFDMNAQQLFIHDINKAEFLPIGFPIQETVIDMKSNYNFCWLLTSKHILKYNTYGSLLSKIPFENGKTMSSYKNNVVIVTTNNKIYNLNQTELKAITLPESILIQDIFLNKENLYIFDGTNKLTTYSKQNIE